jgi:glycosyltransferase involved in cell wall biosynthesis
LSYARLRIREPHSGAIMVECLWRQGSGEERTLLDASDGRIRGSVLHVVNGEHYAGAERVQDLLGGALPCFGYEVAIACVKPGQFSETRKNRQVPLDECPMHGRFDLRPARALVRLIRQRGYDLLHAHTPRSLMIASAASVLASVPLVYHIHSPAVADSTSRTRNWVNAVLERMSLASANHLVAVSNSLRERYLALGFSPERITVVPNGVPCGVRLPLRERSAGEPVVFGMVALFRPRKGLEVLLQAMAHLLAEGKRLRLRAIGQFETPEYEQQIKNLVADLGVGHAIDWTGFRSDIEQELAQIDCFVLPSLFGEGLPMVILEAMTSGRPVIATDVEGTPEAIRHGENGLLAQPNDPAALADAMRLVAEGAVNLETLAGRAAEDQREHFSVCSMTRGVASVYDRVLGHADEIGVRDGRDMPCEVLGAGPQGPGVALPPLPIEGPTPRSESPLSP